MKKHGLERAAVGLAVLTLAISSCGSSAKTVAAPKGMNTLTIIGSEYKFELDKPSIDEGTAQVTFKNAGKEYHVAGLERLRTGTSFPAFKEAVLKDFERVLGFKEGIPGLVEETNAPDTGLLSPGQQTTITTNLLEAGTYAFLCFLPSTTEPHFVRGMIVGLEVKAAETTPTPFDVSTDGDVLLMDHSFGPLPEALTKGKGTIKFSNQGKEPHDAALVRFQIGKSFKDADDHLKAFFEENHGPPTGAPVVFLGGFLSIAPGASTWLTIDLPPGKYGLTCDGRTEAGKSHGQDLGMRVTFDVA